MRFFLHRGGRHFCGRLCGLFLHGNFGCFRLFRRLLNGRGGLFCGCVCCRSGGGGRLFFNRLCAVIGGVGGGSLRIGGLNVGSDVRINGIKVGTVIAQNLDPEDYVADVKLSISSNIQLPKDSVVSVVSDGLVGNKFIKIEPGKSKEFLQNGDTVANTKDFKTLEDMVGEIIFMVTDNGDKK